MQLAGSGAVKQELCNAKSYSLPRNKSFLGFYSLFMKLLMNFLTKTEKKINLEGKVGTKRAMYRGMGYREESCLINLIKLILIYQ